MISYTTYQSDVTVSNSQETNTKVTLKLSSTGDLQLNAGQNKLIPQIIRALINDTSPLKDLINSKVSQGKLTAIVTNILRNFKNTQLDTVNGQDADMLGFKLYRKAAGTSDEFIEVSNSIVQWTYEDLNLTNNTTYTYGLTKYFNNTAETEFIDQIDIFPTKNVAQQQIIIGNAGIFIAGDAKVTLYTDYNVFFKREELLDNIVNIEVSQDKAEPRKYNVLVTVETVLGNEVTISARRLNASTLEAI